MQNRSIFDHCIDLLKYTRIFENIYQRSIRRENKGATKRVKELSEITLYFVKYLNSILKTKHRSVLLFKSS